LLATFLLTIFRDLTLGITAGVALGGILFINRMSEAAAIERDQSFVPRDLPDTVGEDRTPYAGAPQVPVYRIRGPFFFGAAATIGQVLDQAAATHQAVVIDLSEVPFLDSTAARTLVQAAARAQRQSLPFVISGAAPGVRRALLGAGIRAHRPRFRASASDALAELASAGAGREDAVQAG
jgi:SulP family sulfate permease